MGRDRAESYDSEVTERYLLESEDEYGFVEEDECDTSCDEGEPMDVDSEGVPGIPGFWER